VAEPLSIVFVSPFARPAGSERYLGLVLDGIPPEWIADVVFLEEGPFADEIRARGHRVTVLPTSARLPGLLASAGRLRRLLRRTKPTLVHANGIKAALVAGIATMGTGIGVVWVKHDLSFDRSLARPVALRCRLVVGVSEAATRIFRGRLRRRVRIVPNGLPPTEADRERGRARVRELLGAAESDPVVALVGRLYAMKGQHELIAVVPELLARAPGLRVALVGGEDPSVPEYASVLRERVHELGLDETVAFLGAVDDAPLFIAGCDVVAVPSVPAERGNTESFSLVALEAMAVGTPVVAYAEGGLPEVLGSCALLSRTGDRAALRDAILRVLEDDSLRRRLSECGRERAATEFGLDRMIDSLVACYREASSPAPGT
jgi:glycosyltransferase involved in cell wall biosynthesis